MNKQKVGFSLALKITILSLILTLVGMLLVSYEIYVYADEVLQKNALDGLSKQVEREAFEFKRTIKRVKEDVTYLLESPAIAGIARSLNKDLFDEQENMNYEGWQERTQKMFKTVLNQRNVYKEIRLIGVENNHLEIARVYKEYKQVKIASKKNYKKKVIKVFIKKD